MKSTKSLIVAAFFAATVAAAPANAAVTLVDFSGHAAGSQIGTTYAPLGLTFSTASFLQCNGGCPLPNPNGFFAYNNANPFTAFFSTAQNIITFQTVSASSTLAQAYDAMGNLIASASDDESFPVSNATNTLSGNGITRVVFSTNGKANGPTLTNLSFNATGAVPEPATWLMMILGFGGIGFAMRRQAKVRTTVSYA